MKLLPIDAEFLWILREKDTGQVINLNSKFFDSKI